MAKKVDPGAKAHINDEWLEKIHQVLGSAHNELSSQVPAPQRIWLHGTGYRFEFIEKSLEQALVLKLARVVTGLRAAAILMEHGYLQESAALQRTMDEIGQDIQFLVYGKLYEPDPKLHTKYFAAFWSDDPESKPSLRRPEIRDYIARVQAKELGESEHIVVSPMISTYAVYSGYVHASSIHVTELFGGDPLRWRLNGVIDDNLQKDHKADLWNQYYRGVLDFSLSARAFGNYQLSEHLLNFAREFSSAAGQKYFS